jgi:hypothetical protein
MTPISFPEANCNYGPPPDLADSQCDTVKGYVGTIKGGSLDGSTIVVTAWQPTEEERFAILSGKPIFLACIGGLPPHYLATDFQTALNPQ